mgnify:CR=1 FL=1
MYLPSLSTHCSICYRVLPQRHMLGSVCERAECRVALARRHGGAAETQQQVADEALKGRIAPRYGVRNPERFPVYRLRVQRHPVVRQMEQRIAQLRRHLQAITEEAFGSPRHDGCDRCSNARDPAVDVSRPPALAEPRRRTRAGASTPSWFAVVACPPLFVSWLADRTGPTRRINRG